MTTLGYKGDRTGHIETKIKTLFTVFQPFDFLCVVYKHNNYISDQLPWPSGTVVSGQGAEGSDLARPSFFLTFLQLAL